ncbi:unnamed protein product [Aphanomyces euteiches]
MPTTTLQIVAGTYEGMLYGWEAPMDSLTEKEPKSALKMIYGYPAHTECIKAVATMMETDGKTLLTGGNDEMIKIYNVKKKVEVGILMQHKGAITCLEYYGKSHVLSGSADNTICIWRTSDWNCIHILGGHKGPVNSIAVHPSGKLAFSVARDKTLRMWNLVKGRSAYIRRLDQEATCVFLSQDGNRYGLVMGSDVSIFGSTNAEVPSAPPRHFLTFVFLGQLIGSLEHKKKVHTAAFATNDLVVLGTDDGILFLYRAEGQLLAKISHPDITARIRCIKVVQKEESGVSLPFVVLASTNGVVQVYDLAQFAVEGDNAFEENSKVQPVASSKLYGTAHVTCLSACRLNVGELSSTKEPAKDPAKQAKKKEAKPTKAAVTPKIVIEHEVTEEPKKAKRKAPEADGNGNKKAKHSNNAGHKAKGKKQGKH